MPSIFKQQVTRYVDENGKRVRKSTPGARRIETESKKWYGEYTDEKGETHRVPLARDKSAAQLLLSEHVRKCELRQAGLVDPFEKHQKTPLTKHIDEYETHLKAKGNTEKHASQTAKRIRKLTSGCGFMWLRDIDASRVEDWLDQRQRTHARFSAQTRNFYLDASKYFGNWLVKRKRMASNPLDVLERVNVDVDRRHDRRPLTDEEFGRLILATQNGRDIQCTSGPDRAMLYVLAAWTGYRRGELASLTKASFDLKSSPPSVQVKAKSSKRRKKERLPLHEHVVAMFTTWLRTKEGLSNMAPLFALRSASGEFRRTGEMMRKDLEAARSLWLQEVEEGTPERKRRKESSFLTYQDTEGLFADFHANRHTFITNLGRAGVSLAMAQKLARHSDPRLTANIYTHLELVEQADAISQLPALAPTTPTKSLVTGMVTGEDVKTCRCSTELDAEEGSHTCSLETRKPLPEQGFSSDCQCISSARPVGFEPTTLGSEDRCAIQLRHGRLIA